MLYKYSNIFVLFSSSVSALALNDPAATKCMVKGEGEAAEPTQPPIVHDLRIRDVLQKTLLAASDNTCGFFGGSTDKPWGCSASSTCVFETAMPTTASSTSTSIYTSFSLSVSSTISTSLSVDTVGNLTSTQSQTISETITHTQVLTETQFASTTTTIAPTTAGSVLCCDAASGCPTAAPTACVDRGKYDYNSTCTGSCPDDPMTLKCTSGIYIYCATLTFPTPSISALYCNYLSTYPASPAAAATGSNFTATTVSHFIINPTPTPPSNSSSKTGKASASATAESAKGGSASKGPIIGGVVGGLAAVALVVGLVIFFLRRRRAQGAAAVPEKEASLKGGANVGVQAK